MKRLLLLLLMLPMMAISQDAEEQLLTLQEFTVKLGHSAQFMDGIKKVKECYTENGGTDTWNFWSRVQGEGNVYGVSSFMPNWAEMDKEDDEAWSSCRMIVMNFTMPHVESVNYSITQTLSDWSKKSPSDDMKVVWVTYFRVKDSNLFSQIVKDVAGTIAKEEGDNRGYWYAFMGGGENAPDYMISEPYPSYAALDEDYMNPFKVYKKVHGEKKAKQMMDKWKNAVDGSWSYLYKLNEELSN